MAKEIWGYARVSTKEQSLERQLVELRKYVPNEANILSDKQSGKNFDRAEYQRLKGMVREGDEFYVKSLDRLGRNKQMIKDELQWMRSKGVIVHIIDFPQTLVEAQTEQQRDIHDLITNIMVEVLSYVAEEERKATLARQAEGIAVWRRTGKTKTGRPYGRPRVRRPKNWEQVYEAWKGQHIRAKDAWKLLNVSKNIFYRLVHEYEEEMGKQALNT